MTTSAPDWRELLFARRLQGVRTSLAAIEAVVDVLLPGLVARPPFVVVQVVGTNGKGSTSAMIDQGLRSLGHGPVGLFTSPHLERVGERMRIDGRPIDEGWIEAGVADLAAAEATAGVALTFFEVLTAVALRSFVEAGCSHVVLEAGLGGRLDATTVLPARIVAITRIALDHQAILGASLEQIAGEKAGVIGAGAKVFSSMQEPAVRAVIEARAGLVGVEPSFVEALDRSPPSLPGLHQRSNAALALAVLRELDERARFEDIEQVCWPGRLECLTIAGAPGRVWLDVAHNPDGVAALVRALDELGMRPQLIVFGSLADKATEEMLGLLRGRAPLWLVPPASSGAFDAAAHARADERVFAAVDEPLCASLRERLAAGDTVLVCGSHYLVGALRTHLRGEPDAYDGPELSDPRRLLGKPPAGSLRSPG